MTPSIIASDKDLVMVSPHSSDLYMDVPLTSLTAYSLYWLHQWQLPRTIESITVLNWRLFPEKFAMVGFPEFPDAFRTNRSLLQMQPKYRNLLTGAAVKGFSLNANGMEKADELNQKLGVPTTGAGKVLGSITKDEPRKKAAGLARSIEPEREIERVRQSKVFAKWRQDMMGDRDLIHVHTLLRIFDHTPRPVRMRALKDLKQAAEKIGDEEIQRFLADIQATFPHAFTES